MARKRSNSVSWALKPRVPNSTKQRNAFDCPAEIAAILVGSGCLEDAAAGTILFEKGEEPKGVYLLMDGRVALSSGDDPTRITRIAEKNSLLGLPATVRNKPYSLTAEAVTDIRVCHVALERFRCLLNENTTVGLTVINMLAEEISALRDLVVYKVKK